MSKGVHAANGNICLDFAFCILFCIRNKHGSFSTGIFNQTSVMYPLFVAILVMWMKDSDLQMKNWVKKVLIAVLILSAFPADWSCIAVLAILEMYKKRGNLRAQMKEMFLFVAIYSAVSFLFVSKGYALVQIGVLRICIHGDISLLF